MASSNDKVLVIDVDGTLCPVKSEGQSYADLPVYTDVVETLRNYHAEGFRIILHTARNMRTYDGNLGEINKNTLPVLLAWLEKHAIPFDEVVMAKPWAGRTGFYVDDRAIRPDEFITHDLEELKAIVAQGRSRLRSDT